MTPVRHRALSAVIALAVLLSACSSTTPSVGPSGGSGAPASPAATAPAATRSHAPGRTVDAGTQDPSTPGTTDDPGDPTPTDAPPTEPVSTPGSGPAVPLPACAYQDKPAVGDPNTDWATMVLDTIYRLPADFAPRKVVSTSKAGLQKGYEVIPAVIDDLRAMHDASVDADAEIAIRWAYRSYAEQQGAFGYWVNQSGEAAALKKSARPGHSEHQLGTAIDFRSADSLEPPWDYDDWATTEAGTWMLANAWRFGFVLSYPKGKEAQTCYAYEPWHYRYVGRDLARQIHASGETPREFLWELAHPAG